MNAMKQGLLVTQALDEMILLPDRDAVLGTDEVGAVARVALVLWKLWKL